MIVTERTKKEVKVSFSKKELVDIVTKSVDCLKNPEVFGDAAHYKVAAISHKSLMCDDVTDITITLITERAI